MTNLLKPVISILSCSTLKNIPQNMPIAACFVIDPNQKLSENLSMYIILFKYKVKKGKEGNDEFVLLIADIWMVSVLGNIFYIFSMVQHTFLNLQVHNHFFCQGTFFCLVKKKLFILTKLKED